MKIIALIPARGGSKGIKNKNLVKINNKSLVLHSIEHALNSKSIDRVIVSTDSEKIAKLSQDNGAEVPFMRPHELAEDNVLDLPVFEHALNFLGSKEKYSCDIVVHLRPTAPYREVNWIDEAVKKLIDNPKADSVRSVSLVEQHPYRVFEIGENNFLLPLLGERHPEPYLLRRQDLPKMYYYNCVIDVTRSNTIFNKSSMTGNRILPYIIDSNKVYDIDSLNDLQIARLLLDNSNN